MARMSREFSLVLLGAGLLTAGYFLWPQEDPIEVARKEAANGGGTSGRPRYGHVFFIATAGRSATSAHPSSASVSRGGFGRIGVGMSGG